jgi:hypothetical protein
MTFIEEYRKLYERTSRDLHEHRGYPEDCLAIKESFEEKKQILIEKYRNMNRNI